ncbi:MAG: RNA polymerase subunit sigma-70 [Bacteroidetes bacterium]|nr:MAG: RNA polymerase subunit sigma-70 [Bacteroidota bacterium]PTM11202.1 MAG: RNA polymerase subunit sigma-70 [Bacteroidota bacterium]
MSHSDTVCEESVYTAIFKDYANNLYHFLYYKTGNLSMAQDLTQEAFTRLWQNCQAVLKANAKGYVFKIANNLLLNTYKHRRVVLQFEHRPQSEAHHESPAFLLEEKELKAQLETAIAALPEKQRVVFLLSRIDKKTYQEIADLLGISKQTVEKRMYNALDTLRQLFAGIR